MVNYREILRLHSLNYSQREIAASVYNSRSTIQQVLSLALALKISWPLPPETTNAVVESLLYPERVNKDTDLMLPDFPKIHNIRGFPVRLTVTTIIIFLLNDKRLSTISLTPSKL